MKKETSKVIPVAERIIEFDAKALNQFEENPLVIVDGWHILRYAEEYPIVRYQCDHLSNVYLEGGPRLNSFIEKITVSTALNGKNAWFGPVELTWKDTDCDTVVYYTDHVGINHTVMQYDIYCFLLKRPKLVVSPEGVLLFFTGKQIIATVDCNQYHWIDWHVIDVKEKTIKDIEVWDDYCKVILIDDKEVEQCFSLKFDFDISAHHMIQPKATEL